MAQIPYVVEDRPAKIILMIGSYDMDRDDYDFREDIDEDGDKNGEVAD